MNNLNIIIADDHAAARLGIKFHLKNFDIPGEIFEAENGMEVIRLLSENPVDLVFMDMKMPGMNGFETTALIRERHPMVKIVITSLYDEEALIVHLVRRGIFGYILKNDPKLEEGLAACVRGDFYFSSQIEPYYIRALQKEYKTKPVKLTPREEKLLPLIAQGKNSQEIADELALSKFTVESYRKELLAKFDLSNSTALVDFAYRIGLL